MFVVRFGKREFKILYVKALVTSGKKLLKLDFSPNRQSSQPPLFISAIPGKVLGAEKWAQFHKNLVSGTEKLSPPLLMPSLISITISGIAGEKVAFLAVTVKIKNALPQIELSDGGERRSIHE